MLYLNGIRWYIKLALYVKVIFILGINIKTTFLNVNIIILLKMHNQNDKNQYTLHLKCITWYKDSHSLFDY